MATQLQIRRGTAAQVAAFTGAEGEIVYNSTNDSLHTNDGATAGGFELARADLNNVSDADLNAALTGNTLSALTITTLTAGAATFSGNITTTSTDLSVDSATTARFLLDRGTTGYESAMRLATAGSTDWFLGMGASGGTNGDLEFYSYGTTSVVLNVAKATGAATFSGDVNVSGANPDNSLLSQLSVKSTAALANGNASGISFWANTSTGLGSYASIQTVTTGDYAGKLVFTTRNGAGVFDPRMTLDASGNLLVGTTDTTINTSSSVSGHNLFSSGYTVHSRSGQTVMSLNRLSNDGTIVDFRKDGATVGSIGVLSNRLYAGTGDTGFFFSDTTNGIHPWNTTSNSPRDAGIDLGSSDRRFKDLYLSGGVYLGGTGAANKLDDYEETTWTPAQAGVTITVTAATATKVGRLVTVILRALWPANSDSTLISITGLPWVSDASSQTTGALMLDNPTFTAGRTYAVSFQGQSSVAINFYQVGTGVTWAPMTNTNMSGAGVILTFTYTTDA